jgi:hypothetical protein
MYKYSKPKPLIIKLIDPAGFDLRQKAAKYISDNKNVTGAERGSAKEQGFGALAEMVVRNQLGMPEINPSDHPVGYDLLLPTGVKVDVKCRGGELPFQEEYLSNDNIPREAKHNLFARQVYDDRLDTDIYLMTHLETPKKGVLPGTKRQKKWILYICGWVSKERAKREGVYVPRGSLSERGRKWLQYKGQEIEFYNKNLNGLLNINELLKIDGADVKVDIAHKGDLNLTAVDAIRITYDLIGRGILNNKHLEYIKEKTKITNEIKPILSSNQYFHLLEWFKEEGLLTDQELEKAALIMKKEPYTSI